MVEGIVASVDQHDRCVVCGRRDEHCADCHRGHDFYWWTHNKGITQALRERRTNVAQK